MDGVLVPLPLEQGPRGVDSGGGGSNVGLDPLRVPGGHPPDERIGLVDVVGSLPGQTLVLVGQLLAPGRRGVRRLDQP